MLTTALTEAPAGAILVTETLPSSLVRVMSRVAGVISQKGSRASHFASVAREFGLPVIACGSGIPALDEGAVVTLDALRGRVFPGCVEAVAKAGHVPRKSLADLPRKRLEKLLPHVAVLNLVDPESSDFRPEGCRSVYDVTRYAHETALREMFRLAGESGRGATRVSELKSRLPLSLRVLDLGHGLFPAAQGKTEIVADDITSTPLWALWMGFAGAQAKLGDIPLTGFAVIDESYARLWLRAGRRFCVVDAVCEEDGAEGRVTMRVTGNDCSDERLPGLDFLRQAFVARHFHVKAAGGLFEAELSGVDCKTLRQRLVELGRLLMATRLLSVGTWTEEACRLLLTGKSPE